MAAYSIQTLLNDLSGAVHGTTTNKIPNLFGTINRAARAVILDVDPKETQRIVTLSPVFNSVYDYPAPVDLKGDRIIDIRAQAGRTSADIFTQGYSTDFDANKSLNWSDKIYTQWNTGVKTLRIEAPEITAPTTVTDTSSTTNWTVSGGANTLTLDTDFNVAGGGALVFDLSAGSSTGAIANASLSAVDLSSHLDVSTLYAWLYLPSGTAVTGVTLSWGSSASAYWSYTTTQTQQGTSFQTGWNLLAFPWASATVTGSPSSSITYVSVSMAYNSALQTGVKFCNLTSNLSKYYNIVYYSKYLFRNPTTNAFQETVTDVATDAVTLINLDTDSYNLLFNKTAFYVAQSLQGADADYDATFWSNEYTAALTRYRGLNNSEAMLKAEPYYKLPKRGYGFYNGPWPG